MLNRIGQFFYLLTAAIAVIAFAAPAGADIFTIDNINVDVTAENSVEAQSIALENARLVGAERLLKRLTLPEDREKVNSVWIDGATAARLAAAVDIREEKRSGTRYYGVLSVKFDAQKVAQYLEKMGVPFVRSPAARALIMPITSTPELDSYSWRSAWKQLQSEHLLTPLIVSSIPYHPSSNWAEIAKEAGKADALRGVMAELAAHNEVYYVRLSEIRFGEQKQTIGIAGPFADEQEAAKGALEYLETAWKRLIVSRGNVNAKFHASALYTSLKEWLAIRNSLEKIASVTELTVKSITIDGADLSFSYSGSSEQLVAQLNARGVTLSSASDGWIMEARAQ